MAFISLNVLASNQCKNATDLKKIFKHIYCIGHNTYYMLTSFKRHWYSSGVRVFRSHWGKV